MPFKSMNWMDENIDIGTYRGFPEICKTKRSEAS